MILDKIKKICKRKNISISALEKKAGLGNGTIRGWDKSSPTIEKLQAVARILDVSVAELIKEG